jgi:hypothetical protein
MGGVPGNVEIVTLRERREVSIALARPQDSNHFTFDN